jgi:hypothetical protein
MKIDEDERDYILPNIFLTPSSLFATKASPKTAGNEESITTCSANMSEPRMHNVILRLLGQILLIYLSMKLGRVEKHFGAKIFASSNRFFQLKYIKKFQLGY